MMVEVFKTNVDDRDRALWLIEQIQDSFCNYIASFDLEDCDRILVVRCASGIIQASQVIELLKKHNYVAEVLADE